MNSYAVIQTGGKQYRVAEGEVLSVEKLDVEEGKEVIFDNVLLVKDNEKVTIGTPHVEKATVKAEVIENYRDAKIRVMKFKAKSHYKRVLGHRQPLTKVKISKIVVGKE